MLRIYLVLMVRNCTGECSFSKLKLIKNRLRTSMRHDRLSHLALLSVEHDILREIDFDHLITEFARAKSRKVTTNEIQVHNIIFFKFSSLVSLFDMV